MIQRSDLTVQQELLLSQANTYLPLLWVELGGAFLAGLAGTQLAASTPCSIRRANNVVQQHHKQACYATYAGLRHESEKGPTGCGQKGCKVEVKKTDTQRVGAMLGSELQAEGWEGGRGAMYTLTDIPLISSVGQVPLGGLIVVDNADIGTLSNHIHITEVHAVRDVGEEEEVWVSPLVQDAESACSMQLESLCQCVINVCACAHVWCVMAFTNRATCTGEHQGLWTMICICA